MKNAGIPKKFYNVDAPDYPVVVRNVGELIDVLNELPRELEINQDYSFNGGALVKVFNIDYGTHLHFDENDEENEDEL